MASPMSLDDFTFLVESAFNAPGPDASTDLLYGFDFPAPPPMPPRFHTMSGPGSDTPKIRRRLSLGRLKTYFSPSSPTRSTEQPVDLKRLSKHGSISNYDLPSDPFASPGICMSGWADNIDESRRRSESSPRTKRVLQRRPAHLDRSRFPSPRTPTECLHGLSHSPSSPPSSIGPITPTTDVLSFKTFSQEQETFTASLSSPSLLPSPDYLDLSTSALPSKLTSWRPKAKNWLKTRKHYSSDSPQPQPPPVPPKDILSAHSFSSSSRAFTRSPSPTPAPAVTAAPVLNEANAIDKCPRRKLSDGDTSVWWIGDGGLRSTSAVTEDVGFDEALEYCAYLEHYFREDALENSSWPQDHDELPDEESVLPGDDLDFILGKRPEDVDVFYTPKSSMSELEVHILGL